MNGDILSLFRPLSCPPGLTLNLTYMSANYRGGLYRCASILTSPKNYIQISLTARKFDH
jgi:hypothetical protein